MAVPFNALAGALRKFPSTTDTGQRLPAMAPAGGGIGTGNGLAVMPQGPGAPMAQPGIWRPPAAGQMPMGRPYPGTMMGGPPPGMVPPGLVRSVPIRRPNLINPMAPVKPLPAWIGNNPAAGFEGAGGGGGGSGE